MTFGCRILAVLVQARVRVLTFPDSSASPLYPLPFLIVTIWLDKWVNTCSFVRIDYKSPLPPPPAAPIAQKTCRQKANTPLPFHALTNTYFPNSFLLRTIHMPGGILGRAAPGTPHLVRVRERIVATPFASCAYALFRARRGWGVADAFP